jgi:hypothetical protein
LMVCVPAQPWYTDNGSAEAAKEFLEFWPKYYQATVKHRYYNRANPISVPNIGEDTIGFVLVQTDSENQETTYTTYEIAFRVDNLLYFVEMSAVSGFSNVDQLLDLARVIESRNSF